MGNFINLKKPVYFLTTSLMLHGCSPFWDFNKVTERFGLSIAAPLAPIIPPSTSVSTPWDGKLTVVGPSSASTASYKYTLVNASTGVALNPNFSFNYYENQFLIANHNASDYLIYPHTGLRLNSTTNTDSNQLHSIDSANVAGSAYRTMNSSSSGYDIIATTSREYGSKVMMWSTGQCVFYANQSNVIQSMDLNNFGSEVTPANNLGYSSYNWSATGDMSTHGLTLNGNFYFRDLNSYQIYKVDATAPCTNAVGLTNMGYSSIPFVYNNKVHYITGDWGSAAVYDEDGNSKTLAGIAIGQFWLDGSGYGDNGLTTFKDDKHMHTFVGDKGYFISNNMSAVYELDFNSHPMNIAWNSYSDVMNFTMFWGIYNVGGKVVVGAYDQSGNKNLYYFDPSNMGAPFTFLATFETFSSDPVFARYNQHNPVLLNGELFFTASGGSGVEIYKINGAGASPVVSLFADIVVGADSSNPRLLKETNGTIYFVADKADGTAAMYSTNGVASPSQLNNISDDDFMLHNFTVLAQLPSDRTDDLEKFLFSAFTINGVDYINLHGNRTVDIQTLESTTVSGQSGGSNKISQGVSILATQPVKVPYSLGLASLGVNYTRYDSVPIGKHGNKEIFKLFSKKGYQFYSFDGTSLTQLTDMPEGVGQLNDYLSVIMGNKLIFSNLRNVTNNSILPTAKLYSLDLTNNQVTEIQFAGQSIQNASNFILATGTDDKKYLYIKIHGTDMIGRIDEDANAVLVQTPTITGFTDLTSHFGLARAHDRIFFLSPDENNAPVAGVNQFGNPLTQPELDLWMIDLTDPTPTPAAVKVVDNITTTLELTIETSNNSGIYIPGYESGLTWMITDTGMMGRKLKSYKIGDQRYVSIPNSDSSDRLYDSILYINDNGGVEVVANNVSSIVELSNGLAVGSPDGSFAKITNGVSSTLNVGLAPAGLDANNMIMRMYSNFEGYGNKIYTIATEATIDAQTQQPSSITMVLKEITIQDDGSTTVQDLNSLLNGSYNATYPGNQIIMMGMQMSTLAGKSVQRSGSKVYSKRINLPAQLTDFATYDIAIYDAANNSSSYIPIPNLSTTDTQGGNVTLIPASVGFYDSKNLDGLKKRGAFINGLPSNGAFIYAIYMPSTALSNQSFNFIPVLYYFDGTTLEKLYEWSVTMDQMMGFILNPSCFIATAAYGSVLDSHIDTLRAFRDHFLMKFELGRDFVHAYYKHGPALAHLVAQNDIVRAGVRVALWPVVLFSSLSLNYGLFTATLAMLLLTSMLVGLTYVGTKSSLNRIRRFKKSA